MSRGQIFCFDAPHDEESQDQVQESHNGVHPEESRAAKNIAAKMVS